MTRPTDLPDLPDLADLPLFEVVDPGAGSVPAPVASGAATARPAPSRTGTHPGAAVDWAQVRVMRTEAARQLSEARTESQDSRGRALTEDETRELGRDIIVRLVSQDAAAALVGGTERDAPTQQALAEAVFDAVFGMGRLQGLLDEPGVENILAYGPANVFVQVSATGDLHPRDPIAQTDDELIEDLQFIASRSGEEFSPNRPFLDMVLPDGSRLAASAWVSPYPTVVIRRHGMLHRDLDGFVDLNLLTPNTAAFLAAAVRARLSIVVAGDQGAGKTSLLRALCRCIPAGETIGTIETEYELQLHTLGMVMVVPWETRPGSGELGVDGRPAGRLTAPDILERSFRFALSRVIVGEVRGAEVLAMFGAMTSGAGSLSSTHAKTAADVIGKLVGCALQAGPTITPEYALSEVARNVDLVVYVDLDRAHGNRRVISDIVLVEEGEGGLTGKEGTGYSLTHVYRSPARGELALPQVMPESLRDRVAAAGFDMGEYLALGGARA